MIDDMMQFFEDVAKAIATHTETLEMNAKIVQALLATDVAQKDAIETLSKRIVELEEKVSALEEESAYISMSRQMGSLN